jgi:lipocalin
MSATTLIKDRFYSLYAKLLNIYYVRNSLKTSNYVDLNSLKGTWNEIVRNPHPLVTGNSKLLMENVCLNQKGEIIHIMDGEIYPYDNSGSRLLITMHNSNILNTTTTNASSIPSEISGGIIQFWILEYSAENSYLMATDPTLKTFWIFSRQKHIDTKLLNELLREAKTQFGINVDNIITHNL